MSTAPWNDLERLPNLDVQGQARLKHLIEQEHAPKFNNRSGHHLKNDEISLLERYSITENQTPTSEINTRVKTSWREAFLKNCLQNVPFYRHYKKNIENFEDYPTISRSDLSQNVTDFVPDYLPIDRLISYETSGTTGHPLKIPSHPMVAAKYSVFHKKALQWNGVETNKFKSELAVVLAGYQEKCFTYASISPYLNNKGLVKLNFHPNDWNCPEDRQRYLDLNKPDLISGDPISLSELAKLRFTHTPKGILSTSMSLLKGTRQLFEKRFACPVVDVYSLNEVGPVACSVANQKGFKLLQSRLFVEALNADGTPAVYGERGEITLTGGFNDYLPLIRYRTGDFGRLIQKHQAWWIEDLEGRGPVRFKTAENTWFNNVDVTHFMQDFPLSQFSVHQCSDGTLLVTLPNDSYSGAIKQLLESKFSYPVNIRVFQKINNETKVIQYSSDIV